MYHRELPLQQSQSMSCLSQDRDRLEDPYRVMLDEYIHAQTAGIGTFL